MNTFASPVLWALLTVVLTSWLAWQLMSLIKRDGYGLRSASGLPRDWAPPERPSTPYSITPPC